MPIADRRFKAMSLKNVNRSPRKRGVYALYRKKKLVFLGHAAGNEETIRSCLRAHLAARPNEITQYKREPTATPARRLERLLSEYVAEHGHVPRLNAV